MRKKIKRGFEDPARSLNSGFSALEIVSEPLLVQGRCNKREREDKAHSLLAQVGIPQQKMLHKADEFSGGARPETGEPPAPAPWAKILLLERAVSPPRLSLPGPTPPPLPYTHL